MSTAVRDVSAESFDRDVVRASATRPVVVDFWADWCGPCHQLTPVLERVAARYASDVDLVKVDVDHAQAVAARYRVQGIPAVKAFAGGRVVAELVGVQPEPALDALFAGLVPSPAARLVAAAQDAPVGQRRELLGQAVAADPGSREARLALARALLDAGDGPAARDVLAPLVADDDPDALPLDALAGGLVTDADLDELRRAAEADPAARVRLGRALAARGEVDEGFGLLVDMVRADEQRQAAREAVVEVFALLGPEDPRVATWRARLATALY